MRKLSTLTTRLSLILHLLYTTLKLQCKAVQAELIWLPTCHSHRSASHHANSPHHPQRHSEETAITPRRPSLLTSSSRNSWFLQTVSDFGTTHTGDKTGTKKRGFWKWCTKVGKVAAFFKIGVQKLEMWPQNDMLRYAVRWHRSVIWG